MTKTKNSLPQISRAALYIRVSSEEQAMHGLSLEAQKESLYRYAETHQMRVVDLYADEGITARKKYRNRTEFMRMLSDVQQNKIDVILFIKLDRWFRNIADYYEIQKILDAHNVQWITTEERYDTTTANGRLNLNIRLSIAQDESDRTSERIKFVFENKVRRGEPISGKVPFGYRIQDKKMEIDEEKAEIVRDVFQKYIDCRSMNRVQQYLKDRYEIYYVRCSIRNFLTNERYIGRAHGNDHFCPAIIDTGTFETVQQIISLNESKTVVRKHIFLFAGLLECAECGHRLSIHNVHQKYNYYICSHNNRLRGCPHRHCTSELKIERYLLEHLVDEMRAYNAAFEPTEEKKVIRIDTAKIKAKLSRLKELYINGFIDRNEYEQDFKTLKEELEKAEALEKPVKLVDIEAFENLQSAYAELNKEQKKAFWSRTIEKIIIDNNDNMRIFPSKSLLK